MAGTVSIIMPAYNCADFIEEAVASVRSQTYTDWELIIVDDCSTDNTPALLAELSAQDARIRCLKNETNSGAATSRNKAVAAAQGRYLAFLDSDDVWVPKKLEKQIRFMEENGYSFSCTAYDKINERSEKLDMIIRAHTVDYNGLLKHCPGNSTVIYDAGALGKHTIPNIRKRNDYVMWLQVIKKSKKLYGMEEVLSSHRIGMNSISSNKFSLVKYHWMVYREIEKLSLVKSAYLVVYWICKKLFHFD